MWENLFRNFSFNQLFYRSIILTGTLTIGIGGAIILVGFIIKNSKSDLDSNYNSNSESDSNSDSDSDQNEKYEYKYLVKFKKLADNDLEESDLKFYRRLNTGWYC